MSHTEAAENAESKLGWKFFCACGAENLSSNRYLPIGEKRLPFSKLSVSSSRAMNLTWFGTGGCEIIILVLWGGVTYAKDPKKLHF